MTQRSLAAPVTSASPWRTVRLTRRPPRASATLVTSSTSVPRKDRSTSLRTAAAAARATTGLTSPSAWMARLSSRSSPILLAAATTPMPSPPRACSISPTRSSWRTIPPTPLSSGSTSPATSRTWPTPSSARPTIPATNPLYNAAVSLSSIVADWRYAIPNTTNNANGPAFHPVLYVSAGNSSGTGSGVYQSLDAGKTWTFFPDTTYGAVVEGGYLPHVAVTSLSLSLGNVNADTGMSTWRGPMPRPRTIGPQPRRPIRTS